MARLGQLLTLALALRVQADAAADCAVVGALLVDPSRAAVVDGCCVLNETAQSQTTTLGCGLTGIEVLDLCVELAPSLLFYLSRSAGI
jgi:hypothetical protein